MHDKYTNGRKVTGDMESKVKEYQELYSKFEAVLSQAEGYKEPIGKLKAETENLKECQKQYDYTDANVVIKNMEKHILCHP